MKKKRAITHITFAQSIFLNIKFFMKNQLLSYASACSFDFIFSIVPILIMIVLVAVRVLHASPELLEQLYALVPELKKYFNPIKVVTTFQNMRSFTPLELFLIIFILWMARRFFASILASLRNIFHDQQKHPPFINQILAFVFELIVVSIVISVVFLFMSIKTIIALPFFQQFPELSFIYDGFLSGKVLAYIPNLLIFLLITIIYKIAAGTRPPFSLCILAGFLCTMSFWVFRLVLHLFLNVNRYNLIYGVLGNAIILLMDIFFFFAFFLFFAQYIFVCQFFDELLLGELYLLPKKDDSISFSSALRRTLFIRPDFLIARDTQVIYLSAGETIYKEGERDNFAYYIIKGSIKITRNSNDETLCHRGDFFGELNCILSKPRSSTAKAVIDCQIIRIKGKTFRFLVKQNPAVAQKVLSQISSYFAKFYEEQTLL